LGVTSNSFANASVVISSVMQQDSRVSNSDARANLRGD
jgi:hypothetical protein